MVSHADVIRAFGGNRQLAEAIGVDPRVAIHWSKRGIPAKFWPLVERTEIAKAQGVTAFLLRDLKGNTP